MVPSTVATGDTVNVFAQDFPNVGHSFSELKIGGETTPPTWRLFDPRTQLDASSRTANPSRASGSGSVTFEVPGGYEGTLRIDAAWGTGDDEVSENSKITIGGADLIASKTDVLPNETITINGTGFGSQTCIDIPRTSPWMAWQVMVHEDSYGPAKDEASDGILRCYRGFQLRSVRGHDHPVAGRMVRNAVTNPTLIPGTHALDVTDSQEYGARHQT